MEILIYQVVIAGLILVAGAFGKKTRNIVTLLICLFTVVEVFTFKLAILQFITIFIAYVFSIGYEEKKAEEKRLKKKEESNYYVIDKKKKEKSESSFGRFSVFFIIVSSLFCAFYVFQKKAELKKESIEIKKDTVVNEKGKRIYDPVQETIVNDVAIDNNVSNDISEKDYFSSDDNLVEYNKDVDSNVEYCIHNDLSYKYEYAIVVKRSLNNKIDKILIQIKNKETSETLLKHISLVNGQGNKSQFYDDAFTNCNFVCSYITGFNQDKETADWEYGDFIVGDFNFDQNEDFAIKINKGGANVGPAYAYYTKRKNGEFVLDDFLFGYPPDNLDKDNVKISYSATDENGYTEKTYMYNKNNEKWILIKSVYKLN